jgi:hypothetical protein
LQVRCADPCQSSAVFVSLFLSLRPLNGPWGSMSWMLTTAAAASTQSNQGDGALRAADSLSDAQ